MGILKIFDQLPDLRGTRFLYSLAVASVMVVAIRSLRSDTGALWTVVPAMVLSVVAVFGWSKLKANLSARLRTLGLAMVLSIPFIIAMLFLNRNGESAFPVVFAFLLGLVAGATHQIEKQIRSDNADSTDLPVHSLYHRTMNLISSVLFVFGVISLWPWLGEMYGPVYFWILVLGVLSPILFFWGRLRQPKREGSLIALYRFNRILPYVGILLLVAVAVG